MKQFLCLAIVVSLLGLPSVSAQDEEEFFSTFEFRDLKFQIWPAGLENRQDSDAAGSAITVHVARVKVEGLDALDLRRCIDGDTEGCPYSIPGGNNDGTVIAAELTQFQTFAQIGLRAAVPRVNELMQKLEANLSIDDKKPLAKHIKITKVLFEGAEGPVEREDTIMADIDAKVTFENDPAAKEHVIKVGNLELKPGFVYDNAIWSLAAEGWRFAEGDTNPKTTFVNSQGYYSPQDQFESLSAQGFQMTIEKSGSGKRSPGPELALFVLALVGLLVVRRRN